MTNFGCGLRLSVYAVGTTGGMMKIMIMLIFLFLAAALPSRATDLCEASQQCSGVGR